MEFMRRLLDGVGGLANAMVGRLQRAFPYFAFLFLIGFTGLPFLALWSAVYDWRDELTWWFLGLWILCGVEVWILKKAGESSGRRDGR